MNKLHATVLAAFLATSGFAYADHDGMGEHCKMHTQITFEQADKDKDGTLDREEAKAVCGEKFDVMDTDKDGTLTKEEAKGLKKIYQNFEAIDADKDGTVDRDEVHEFMHSKKAK